MASTPFPAVLSALCVGMLCLCSCTASSSQTLTNGQTAPTVPVAAPAAGAQTHSTFESWRTAFRTKALSSGISAGTFDAAFAGVRPNPQVLELDGRQPEFTRPIWEYLDGAVSDGRVATGQAKARDKRSVLAQIEKQFGVDSEAVLAIWGLESSYGGNFGSMSVIRSMATLAYEGRRKQFAEAELLGALRILQAGDITPQRMVGSWAGAMGHTQFIPSSFLSYAVDFTGDGKRDLWAPDAVDALASTANYLSKFGWIRGLPPVIEVTLPADFDYLLADDAVRRPVAEWQRLGVRGVGGRLPLGDELVSILLPAGAKGPAFAAFPNFRTIKRYNNSTSYALAVSKLADRIRGGPGIAGSWPRGDRPLSRTEKQELQSLLTALGFDTKGVDGIIGPNSRAAVRQFQKARGLVPDGYVSAELLRAVRSAGG